MSIRLYSLRKLNMKNIAILLLFVAGTYAAPGRIVGGEDASIEHFPYLVSLQFEYYYLKQHICGGSILTPEWILTAGHCVTEVPLGGKFYIKAGATKLSDRSGQKISVSKIIVHPNYKGGVNPDDIALLKLSKPLQFNNLVKPIQLPKPHEEVLGDAVISGWGVLQFGAETPSNILQMADVVIYENQFCRKQLIKMTGTDKPFGDGNVCIGPITGGLSPCSGDSGGPLVYSNKAVGVASWVVAPCGVRGAPAVYTKVSAYIDFIRKYVPQY